MTFRILVLSTALIALTSGCKRNTVSTSLTEIISVTPYEDNVKAKIEVKAIYRGSQDEKSLKEALKELYEESSKFNDYEIHSKPDQILVYIYSTYAGATDNPSSFIAMMHNTFNHDEPAFELNPSRTPLENSSSSSDVYSTVKELQAKKNIDICNLYAELRKINKDTRDRTESEYNRNVKNTYDEIVVIEDSITQRQKRLFSQKMTELDLADSLGDYFYTYGEAYCN